MKIIKQCEICGMEKCDCVTIPQLIDEKHEIQLLLEQMASFENQIDGVVHNVFLNRAKKFMY